MDNRGFNMIIEKEQYAISNELKTLKVLCPICKTFTLYPKWIRVDKDLRIFFLCNCTPIMSYNPSYFIKLRPQFIRK